VGRRCRGNYLIVSNDEWRGGGERRGHGHEPNGEKCDMVVVVAVASYCWYCSHGISRQNDIRLQQHWRTDKYQKNVSNSSVRQKSIEANLPSGGSFGGRGNVVAGKNLLDSPSKLASMVEVGGAGEVP
jgi:hypothetical protein